MNNNAPPTNNKKAKKVAAEPTVVAPAAVPVAAPVPQPPAAEKTSSAAKKKNKKNKQKAAAAAAAAAAAVAATVAGSTEPQHDDAVTVLKLQEPAKAKNEKNLSNMSEKNKDSSARPDKVVAKRVAYNRTSFSQPLFFLGLVFSNFALYCLILALD